MGIDLYKEKSHEVQNLVKWKRCQIECGRWACCPGATVGVMTIVQWNDGIAIGVRMLGKYVLSPLLPVLLLLLPSELIVHTDAAIIESSPTTTLLDGNSARPTRTQAFHLDAWSWCLHSQYTVLNIMVCLNSECIQILNKYFSLANIGLVLSHLKRWVSEAAVACRF